MNHRGNPLLAWTISIAAHLAVFAALFWPHAASPPEIQAIPVNLVQLPKPETASANPPGLSGVKVQQAALRPSIPTLRLTMPVLPVAAPAKVAIREAENAPIADDFSDLLSASDLAGAASAGEGGTGSGGGGCDLARAVQQALRRDPLVHNAVANAGRAGKSVMLWNGDWVRAGGQDGKGLSAVREAILWEVGFAPQACRNARLHGLVLLSLADGTTRFAIGSGDWRWSDLLGVAPSYR